MTRQAFNFGYVKLMSAFPNQAEKITEATQEVYWEALREIPDDLWGAGFRKCLAGCRFFPTINELGAACCGEQKEQIVWREDPWRKRQHYTERLLETTWQQNLRHILIQRKAIEAPEEFPKIGPPEKPDYIKNYQPVQVGSLLRNCLDNLDRRFKAKEQTEEKERHQRTEERRKILGQQAKILLSRD